MISTTEYIWNERSKKLSHLVVEDTFADLGDAATVCGLVTSGADLYADYDLCPECIA
mgnify:CR=1 FL=1